MSNSVHLPGKEPVSKDEKACLVETHATSSTTFISKKPALACIVETYIDCNFKAVDMKTHLRFEEWEYLTKVLSEYRKAESISNPHQAFNNKAVTSERHFSSNSARNKVLTDNESIILKEGFLILQSLVEDISDSLDEIPKSIALPAVIEKYSSRCVDQRKSPSKMLLNHTDLNSIELLGGLQCRCLEYREMISDIAQDILSEYISPTEQSGLLIAEKESSYKHLKENFTNFRVLGVKLQRGGSKTSPNLSELITDCMQTCFLRLLQEQNETYLVRLEYGIRMTLLSGKFTLASANDFKNSEAEVKK